MPSGAADAFRSFVEALAREGLLLPGGGGPQAATVALLRSWKGRDEWFRDEEAVEEALMAAADRSAARLLSDSAVVAGRPVAARIVKSKRGGKAVELVFQSGLRARWTPPDKFWDMRLKERQRLVFDLLVVEVVERGGGWMVERLKPLRTVSDPEALRRAMALCREVGLDAVMGSCLAAVAAAVLTVPPDVESAEALAMRLLLALSGDNTVPAHVVEMSALGTLKSATANLLEAVGVAWHITEWPTVATLLGDARTGYTRLSSVELVVFDEFTKWERRRGDSYDIWSAVANGMALCKWRRAAGGAMAPAVDKCISTLWLGNPFFRPVSGGTVPPIEYYRKWLADVAGLDDANLASMLSRVSAWGWYEPSAPSELIANIHGYVPRPGLLLAIRDTLRDIDVSGLGCGGDARSAVRERYVGRALAAVLVGEELVKRACEIVRGVYVHGGGHGGA